MKDRIKEKFLNQRHKWIWFHIDSNEFYNIVDILTESIKANKYNASNAMDLIKSFKFHEKAFVKFLKFKGRKDFLCACHIIDKENNKIEINLSPDSVLNANILLSSPKSLKLYKSDKKQKGKWKKPDDGFVDPVEYPPVEEELTELGYSMYKDWQEEIQRSGLSAEEYKKKLFGVSVIYTRSF